MCDMSTEYQIFVIWHVMTVWHENWISDICDMTWHDCVTWVPNIRYLWHDVSRLCDMSTKYQKFVTVTLHFYVTWVISIRYCYIIWLCYMRMNMSHLWHDMSVLYEYWISEFCNMTWRCDMSTEYQTFVKWRDMTLRCDMSTESQMFVERHDWVTCVLIIRHLWQDMSVCNDYWISDIWNMTWHVCVIWVLNIRYLWHDMLTRHEYWISDICDMRWLCDMCTDYQIFVTWLECMTWVLYIRYFYMARHDCVKWVMNIRHLCHDRTVWLKYWISDICDMT